MKLNIDARASKFRPVFVKFEQLEKWGIRNVGTIEIECEWWFDICSSITILRRFFLLDWVWGWGYKFSALYIALVFCGRTSFQYD